MAARKVWNILPTNYFLITTLRAPYSSRWTQLKNTKLYLRGWVNILKLWSFRCHNVEVLCHIYLILLHDVNSRCRLLLCNHVLVKRHGLIPFKAIVVTSMKFLELQNTLLLPNCILKRGRDVDTIPITRFFYPSSSRKQALYEHQPVALFNSSSPNISMSILHTVLYKFPVVLIRICLTRKTFFHLLINFHFSSWSLCSI